MTFLSIIWGFLKGIPWQVWAVIGIFSTLATVHLYLVHEAVAANDAKWEAKAEAARVAYAKAVQEANDRTHKQEAEHIAALAALGAKYAQDVSDLEKRRARDVAAARAGSLRLSIPAPACGASQAGNPASGSDGAPRIDLPAEVTASLYALADDADAAVAQLTACQAVIRADRVLFGDRP